MSRSVFFVLILVLLIAGAWYLSTTPREVPTQTIETEVAAPANAS